MRKVVHRWLRRHLLYRGEIGDSTRRNSQNSLFSLVCLRGCERSIDEISQRNASHPLCIRGAVINDTVHGNCPPAYYICLRRGHGYIRPRSGCDYIRTADDSPVRRNNRAANWLGTLLRRQGYHLRAR